MRTRIIFYNVTSDDNPAFVLLIWRFQLPILEMSKIHQWRKTNFSALISCFTDQRLSCFWFSSAAMPGFSSVFPTLLHCCFASGIFNAWGISMNLWTRLKWVIKFIHVAVMWSCWGLCPAPSNLGLVAFVGINNTSVFCLVFPNIALGFSTVLYRYFARHCCWHRNFQLSPSGFHCELEFFIVWFNKEYSSQLSGIVELWFLKSPSLFLLFFLAASGINFHTSGHTTSGREFFLFPCKSPTWTMYILSGGLSFNWTNLVNPVPCIWQFLFSIHFPVIICVFPTLRPVTYMLIW